MAVMELRLRNSGHEYIVVIRADIDSGQELLLAVKLPR
jgi:hypothetical protein